jgi:hypothetical protein
MSPTAFHPARSGVDLMFEPSPWRGVAGTRTTAAAHRNCRAHRGVRRWDGRSPVAPIAPHRDRGRRSSWFLPSQTARTGTTVEGRVTRDGLAATQHYGCTDHGHGQDAAVSAAASHMEGVPRRGDGIPSTTGDRS